MSSMDFSEYLGAPYEDRGCWIFIRKIFKEKKGIELDDNIYTAARDFVEVWYDGDMNLSASGLRVFDILCMRRRKPYAEHVCMMVNDRQFMHGRRRTGACIEPLDKWKSRIVQIARHRLLQ